MSIFADIGGTYARFAQAVAADDAEKFPAAEFPSFEDALNHYCRKTGIKDQPSLKIATAAYPDNDVWQFVNQNKWVIDPAELKKRGWPVEVIMNDFEAATWGLLALRDDEQDILKQGVAKPGFTRCLSGPGTGLGLGYLLSLPDGQHHVQRTHGGHFPAAALREQHWSVINTVKRMLDKDGLVFENLVSGPGLLNIYNALVLTAGKPVEATRARHVLEAAQTQEGREAIRLFHEFFGIFCSTVTVAGHAYGGLYLTGGMLDRLIEHDLFNFEHFENYFVPEAVRSVKKDLQETPVIYIKGAALALRGLQVIDI